MSLGAGAAIPRPASDARRSRRAFWSRQLRQWHWISSAIALAGMLGFAATGITLNHAAGIEGALRTTRLEAVLPPLIAGHLTPHPARVDAPLPASVAAVVAARLSLDLSEGIPEWSDDEVYVALPRPGGDAFVTIDRRTGEVEYEATDRGWIAYLNDLHKGRNAGLAWAWFIDAFAAVCVVFCLSGLGLLYLHGGQRAATWPLVGLGVAVPVLLAVLLIH